ncbi:hypothetical protein [Massilia sp. BJB1822]|uniref:hypothetical protein n=1 Tax=Massilia sp. BJB1822 TaxID=2744470 RepID=UPI001593D1E1|nr:hypothetical protein [Massilia sp. BJB1822]NVE00193.1 hypothetical protein [Massilia sp. BJB1822]
MMTETPDFLQHLDLPASADARDVRRADARAVKLIDQENDPAAFQQLREAYESALLWLKRSDAPAVRETVVQAAPPAATAVAIPEPVPAPVPEPDLFVEFHAHFRQLAESSKTILTEAEAKAELLRCLGDDRLLNIDARSRFEQDIAQLLVGGWQAGHDALLPAAIGVFSWSTDARGLRRLGYTGAVLNRLIDENEIFKRVWVSETEAQLRAMARSRDPRPPSMAELQEHLPHLQRAAARYPTTVSLLANRENLELWESRQEELQQHAAEQAREQAMADSEIHAAKVLKANGVILLLVIAGMLIMLSIVGKH